MTKGEMRISPIFLLSIYGVVPLAIIFVLVDRWLLSGHVRDILPAEPETFLLFSLLFTLPHILASFFSLLDKEYFNHYKTRLTWGSRFIVFASILIPLISVELALYTYAIFTMIHVFFQQAGISKILMKGSNEYHQYWRWAGVFIAIFVYLSVYAHFEFSFTSNYLFHTLVVGFFLIYSLLGLLTARSSSNLIGTWYLWGTHSLPILGFLFVFSGYPILAIALPRIIHDISAFFFYVSHDHNRFLHTQSNILYRYTSSIGIPVLVVSPILAILIASPFQISGLYQSSLLLLMMLGLMHYYIESFIWKGDSLHRKEIKIAA